MSRRTHRSIEAPQAVTGPLGTAVRLRPPRFDDYAEWRRIRLRDRAIIEPYWVSSEQDWPARHTARHWVRECLDNRADARAGRRMSMVIEVAGRFAGQVELASIDASAGSAELGIWIGSAVAGGGIGALVLTMITHFGFHTLGLMRISAPIAPGNIAAAKIATAAGLRYEARMRAYFDAGGARRDHELWAVTSADRPDRGLPAVHPARQRPHPQTTQLPAASAAPHLVSIAVAYLRYQLSRVLRVFRWLRGSAAIALTDSDDRGEVLVRSRRVSDFRQRRAARIRNRATLARDPHMSPAAWLRRHSLRRWLAELAEARTGLRSRPGLTLTILDDGRFAGEVRLHGLDMFDRNVRLSIWTDASARPELRARVLRLLVRHATERLGILRIATAIPVSDPAAAAAVAAVGFAEEGRMRGHLDVFGPRGDHDLWAYSHPAGTAAAG
ncbi:GNAT family N-acetyltransferase [Nocardia beijingensis]|uniref:GNAT family N-acetyltransferase n=1 Tax=Nocardia beijingensis TaxID=95162 RepID=UPI0008354272|nr:GNAT family protein [Nocardia beijingensis]